MAKRLILLVILFSGITYVQGQKSITKTITYDFTTGQLSSDAVHTFKRKKECRLTGIREGQAVILKVINLNPLKYKAEANGASQSIFDAPPAIKGPGIETFTNLEAPKLAEVAEKTPVIPTVQTEAVKRFNQGADLCEPIDPKAISRMKEKINDVILSIENIKKINSNIKSISIIFQSFENYIKRAASLENLTQTDFQATLDHIVTKPLTKPEAILNAAISIRSNGDVNKENFEQYKNFILDRLKDNETKLTEAYESLYDLVLQNGTAAQCVEKYYKNGKADNDLNLIRILLNLPETKKEFTEVRDWARRSNETVKDKLWPVIDQSVIDFEKYYSISFNTVAITLPADEDLQAINLSIKSIADNKEVRKVNKIVVYTNGGFRVDYGVGLYFSGLSDDEFVLSKNEKIAREAYIKDDQTIDSVLKNVTYTTISDAKPIKANWGAMAFIQGRSNWASWTNIGGYVGMGLLSNNESKPIFSLGGSLIFGRIKRASLNIGMTWGRVQRLNPKYEVAKEYKGDITDLTFSSMSKSYLVGLHWKIGSVK